MERTENLIETSCVEIGDGDNYKSVLVSDPEISAKGHTQTEATHNILVKLRELGRPNTGQYSFRY